jgi:DNA-directed RNA polymerase subunit RPC12/RpoP
MNCSSCGSERVKKNGGGRTRCADCGSTRAILAPRKPVEQIAQLGVNSDWKPVKLVRRAAANDGPVVGRHFVLPDTQVKKGAPLDHFEWIGAAIREYRPTRLIHLGDHWDMHSLSSWDGPGSMSMEGARYEDDIASGNEALEILERAIGDYACDRVILRGNHEDRIRRAINGSPRFSGTIGEHHFNDKRLGWDVVEYFNGSPGIRYIDGVAYAHYFAAPNTGKPINGTIQNRLAKIGDTFIHGHVQGLFQGNLQYATGRIRHGIVAGSCYLHDEDYKGHANAHWRGVLVLNEVRDGQFCEMPLTLDYLCRKYTGMALSKYLTKKYRNARERFSLAAAA